MKVLLLRATLFRIVAIFLLLIAVSGVYTCDVADACVTSSSEQSSNCDQPSGDNCLCCCHHVIPATTVTLAAAESVYAENSLEVQVDTVSMSLPIEHPPQL